MAYTCEGTLEIDLVDFWTWVNRNYAKPFEGNETVFGVPQFDRSNNTIKIDFATSTSTDPNGWSPLPRALLQWKDHKDDNE